MRNSLYMRDTRTQGLGTPTLYTRTPVAVISPPSNEKTKGLCRFMPTT